MNKCKLCQGNTQVMHSAKVYYTCLECEYIFVDKKECIDSHNEKKHYDNHDNNLESLGYVKMFERLIKEFIAPRAKEIKSALDFGCGEGEVLPILLERREISCDRYDLFYFPKRVYEDREYDLIVSTEVFEHLSEPVEILQELLSHLKINGYLLLMTYFHPSDSEKFLKWFYIQDITHIGFFNMKTFEYLADRFNLEIVQHNAKNSIMFKKLA